MKTKLRRLVFVAGIALLAMAIALPGCAGPAPADGNGDGDSEYPPMERPAGEVVIGLSSIGSGSLDPTMMTTGVELMWGKAIFDTLAARDVNGIIQPRLAEEFEISADGVTVNVILRQGVKFHNGMEMTAEDVKWSLDRFVGPDVQNLGKVAIQAYYDSTEIIDPYHLIIHFKDPAAAFYTYLEAYTWIFPKELYEDMPATAISDNPVGTGPYKFVSREGNDVITLTVNEDYWAGVPYVEDLEIREIPDPSTRWAALQNGEIDIADLTGTPFITEAQEDSSMSFARDVGGAIIDLHPMLELYSSEGQCKAADDPFLDARVRLAMSMALDRETIINTFFYGFATPAKSRFMPYSRGYSASDPDPVYDPAEAMQLLTDAGYPSGFTTELHYIDGAGTPTALAEFMQSNWKDIGVDVELIKEDVGTFVMREFLGMFPGMAMRQQAGAFLYEPFGPWALFYMTSGIAPYDQVGELVLEYTGSLDEDTLNEKANAIRQLMIAETTDFPVVYMDWVYVLGPKVQEWPLIRGYMAIGNNFEYIKLKGQ